MKNINRRSWLRLTGLAGSTALLPSAPLWGQGVMRPSTASADAVARLNANENPLGPSQKMREAVIAGFDEDCRYPFAKVGDLITALAEREGVERNQIIVTGGSMEGLKAAGLTFGVHGGEVITPDPTFQSLLSYAAQFGVHINRVPLDEKLEHDLEEMERRITNDTKLVFICNPNNPTGTMIDAKKLASFCDRVSQRTMVFSDEAYFDYISDPGYPSMVELVKQGANVVVSRTFSKVYGMAGMRVGYLIARKDLAARIRPYVMANTNMPAIHAALAALEDQAFYQHSLSQNQLAKNYIYRVLDRLQLKYVRSHANFVFFHTGRPIQQVQEDMRKLGVQVGRPFPPLTTWCRVSTGRMEDVEKFGRAMEKVFG